MSRGWDLATDGDFLERNSIGIIEEFGLTYYTKTWECFIGKRVSQYGLIHPAQMVYQNTELEPFHELDFGKMFDRRDFGLYHYAVLESVVVINRINDRWTNRDILEEGVNTESVIFEQHMRVVEDLMCYYGYAGKLRDIFNTLYSCLGGGVGTENSSYKILDDLYGRRNSIVHYPRPRTNYDRASQSFEVENINGGSRTVKTIASLFNEELDIIMKATASLLGGVHSLVRKKLAHHQCRLHTPDETRKLQDGLPKNSEPYNIFPFSGGPTPSWSIY